jgi:hypothetical protein
VFGLVFLLRCCDIDLSEVAIVTDVFYGAQSAESFPCGHSLGESRLDNRWASLAQATQLAAKMFPCADLVIHSSRADSFGVTLRSVKLALDFFPASLMHRVFTSDRL